MENESQVCSSSSGRRLSGSSWAVRLHYRSVCVPLFQGPAKVVACALNSVGLSAPLHPSPWSSSPVRLGAGWAEDQGGEISHLQGQGHQQTV